MTTFTHRPIDTWPGTLTKTRRRSPFDSTYTSTLIRLEFELDKLQAKHVVIQLALRDGDIRIDGQPRATARPDHPGVILSFDSKHGPLRYATDVFTTWQDNLRAIALGLEALRKVERYGITKRGEQYTGWRQLEAGSTRRAQPSAMSPEEATEFVYAHGGKDNGDVGKAYKRAALRLHPDARTHDAQQWDMLQEAKRALGL